ncbi:hypothetical protein PQ459_08940 [Chryseobacterium sp. KACC 21268]|nr:hypothetical protein PQ459_08940 [Chryseobacterium sp. KACC 21268]
MARTQILKDIRPNIFLCVRKVFGILFLLFIHFISANITNFNSTDLAEEEKSTVDLDSIITNQPDSISSVSNIYISSGTTIVDLDDIVEGKIVMVEPLESDVKNASVVENKMPEKVVKPVAKDNFVNIDSEEVAEQYSPSSQTNFYYSISESFTKAVVPTQLSYTNVFVRPVNIFDYQININLIEIKSYGFHSQNLISQYQNLLSGRAPPILA